ncbi:hypothetical protein [Maribacter hydrothermalis]|uniref:DUF4136 domain-containing protein n=1 Tax=Maribacter hydrothermalis TaxID=1836467 RepID=A0A1B7ZDH7_9FLAO|nr:hypothetical protein [Maribacter hydrothermalis]APQ18403.1 hypothetical protein BTR34_14240 [Maribacter hydrothermalis]OBR41390.1 hypothetical protein A9200_13855 [Maribacter hydrothermalis]
MKRILLLLAIIISFSTTAQKNIYESPNFDILSSNHNILAIIPFLTNLDLNEKVSKTEQKRLEENEGYAVQNALETYFSKRSKKKKLPVTFQNIENTTAILAKNNISYENIDVYTTKELSEILGVDGIISGTLDLNILLSNGVPTEFSFTDYISGGANYGRIGIKISDGITGKLLWKYEKQINKKTGKNTTDLIDRMMKLAIRKFPYERERKRDRNKN